MILFLVLLTGWSPTNFVSLRLNGAGLEFKGRPVVFEKALDAVDMKRNAEAIRLRRGRISRREEGDVGTACRDPVPVKDANGDSRLSTGSLTVCSFSNGIFSAICN